MKKIVTFCLSLLITTTIMADDVWRLLTDASVLKAGDQFVLACNTQGATAGTLSGGYFAMKETTFSADKSVITSLGEGTYVFTLGGEAGAWKLVINEKLIGATGNKSLKVNAGTTTWTISVEDGNTIIASTKSDYGEIQYNKNSPRFTNFATANQTKIQIYYIPLLPSHSLKYKDYPYKKIACEEPVYKVGTTVKLSSGKPTREGHTFLGWVYAGELYQPGADFIMPDAEVELVARWDDWQAIDETSVRINAKKIIRDGQLIIVRDGAEYNVIGVRVK